MVNFYRPRTKYYFLVMLLALLLSFFYAPSSAYAKSVDYSTLSVEEIQKEVSLLYQHARRAYAEDDLELSKFLFYKILEFDPSHRGANRYLDYYIPKQIYKAKLKRGQDKLIGMDAAEIEIAKEQEEVLEDFEQEVVKSEKNKVVKEKYYKKAVQEIPKEEKRRQKLELAQQRRYEAEKRKQEVIQEKEKARQEKEKLLAERREAKRIEAEKKKQEELRKNELAKLVQEQKQKRKQELSQRKELAAEPQKKEALSKAAAPQPEKKIKTVKKESAVKKKAPAQEAEKPGAVIDKGQVIDKTQTEIEKRERLVDEIVEKEVKMIKEEQKRLAKEEELMLKAREKRIRNKESQMQSQMLADKNDSLPLAKLSRKIKEQQAVPKPRPIKEEMGKELGKEEDLVKYLLEQREIAELKLKEDSSAAKKEEVAAAGFEQPAQLLQRYREKEAELTGKSSPDSQERNWDKVKAIYKEGIYNYRAGEYGAAQESFSQILD